MEVIAYKYKIRKQNKNHERKLLRMMTLCCEIYNHALEVKKRYYSLYKKNITMFDMQKHLAKIKKRCYPEWKEINSQTISNITERIYSGYQRFFKKQSTKLPSHKKPDKYYSLTFKNSGWKLNKDEFLINNQQVILRFHKSREICGHIQTITLKRDKCDDWWLIFIVRKEHDSSIHLPTTGKIAGYDFGLKNFLTSDEASVIDCPLFLERSLPEIRNRSRSLSKKKFGSNNYKRAKLNLARLCRKVNNQRSDFHWQLANKLVREYDIISVETLDLKEMQKIWGRKLNNFCFSKFLIILTYCCAKYGRKLLKINQFEPTTKTCSNCGYVLDKISLDTRQWTCPKCGVTHDRDVNAAKNIKRVGVSTLEGEDVRHFSNANLVDSTILDKKRSIPNNVTYGRKNILKKIINNKKSS